MKTKKITKKQAMLIISKGADVSNFGDPIKWQRNERNDCDHKCKPFDKKTV